MRVVGLIALAVGFVATPLSGAQPAAKVARIGVLWQTAPPPPLHPHLAALLKNLEELGWQDGKNVAIEYRYGASDATRLADYANQLVRMEPDVITTAGDLSTRAAQQATGTIPIVAVVGFPVESGFVKSLARPGGNITGVSVIADEASAKRLELLKELLPGLRRVAVLWDPVTHERQPKAVEAAAAELGLEVRIFTARSQGELQGALEAAATARAEALLVLVSPTFAGNRAVIAGRAAQHRLPAMYYSQTFTEAGGLIAYGPPMEEQWRLAATAIDKVLKGTRPAEIPVQRPTRLELDVNLKAAREMGLDIPQSILLRANRVIQ